MLDILEDRTCPNTEQNESPNPAIKSSNSDQQEVPNLGELEMVLRKANSLVSLADLELKAEGQLPLAPNIVSQLYCKIVASSVKYCRRFPSRWLQRSH
ncbi:hypothetical protein RRG08_065187 [Elysia crispata]|uniref:Uncharacterized protein n=1 Tax=Elysia crispata TaxID=231223 RepID=A0AAE0XPP6_9GAST|nr:hypothetical protein RRG08_065187 [Elysia crispata]